MDTSISYDESEVFDFGLVELTFLRFEEKVVFSEDLECNLCVLLEELNHWSIDQAIIHIDEDLSFRHWNGKDVVHHFLECG